MARSPADRAMLLKFMAGEPADTRIEHGDARAVNVLWGEKQWTR